ALNPGSMQYSRSTVFRLVGRLNVAVLKRSLREVVTRHESLRTIFPNGFYDATVLTPGSPELSIIDLSKLSSADAKAEELRRHVWESANRSHDFSAGPLFDARLFRIEKNEHALLLSLHRLVADEDSISILIRELAAIYSALTRKHDFPSSIQVEPHGGNGLMHEEQYSENLQTRLKYWRERLHSESGTIELPLDYRRLDAVAGPVTECPAVIPIEAA